jgi:hypothetical protein
VIGSVQFNRRALLTRRDPLPIAEIVSGKAITIKLLVEFVDLVVVRCHADLGGHGFIQGLGDC